MDDSDLEQIAQLDRVNRQALLAEAAQRVDALINGALGGNDGTVAASAEGDLLRALQEDEAKFADFPQVYRITDQDFLAKKLEAPITFKQLARDYRFYWVRFPISLIPKHNWAFHRLQVRVEFNPNEPQAQARPVAYDILPKKQFQSLLQASDRLEISLDENFQFAAKTGVLAGALGPAAASGQADIKTMAGGGLGLVVGPFNYQFKRAKIDHNTTHAQWVYWSIDGAEFFQENDLTFAVILQVPKATQQVTIRGALGAYRYFNFAAAGLREAVDQLPSAFKTWFNNGLPIGDTEPWRHPWDITAQL